MTNAKIYKVIGISVLILIVLLVFSINLPRTRNTSKKVEPTAPQMLPISRYEPPGTASTKVYTPKKITEIPSLAPENGFGVDTNSQIVLNSQKEIQKLSSSLPYSRDITTKNGIPVSIVISPINLQDNEWTLVIQIFGVDYNTSSDMSSYTPMKTAFKEASQIALDWIQSKGVKPDDLIVQWGDKQFMQDKAEEWLK